MKSNLGVIKEFSKGTSASDAAIAHSLIKRVYPEAIEFTSALGGMRGMLSVFGLFSCGMIFVCAYSLAFWRDGGPKLELLDIFTGFFGALFVLFALSTFVKCLRMELFRPEDEPTIFDRKNRKVYKMSRDIKPGLLGLFKPWAVRYSEHDWNLVDAVHYATLNANTSTVSRMHELIFTVRKSAADETIVASFSVGNHMLMGELTVPAVWEHIRRFMEEHGPHIPAGEGVLPEKSSPTLKECLADVAPWSSNMRLWRRNQPILAGFALIFSPVLLPIALLVRFFAWLSYKTAKPINWPAHVLVALGATGTPCVAHS